MSFYTLGLLEYALDEDFMGTIKILAHKGGEEARAAHISIFP